MEVGRWRGGGRFGVGGGPDDDGAVVAGGDDSGAGGERGGGGDFAAVLAGELAEHFAGGQVPLPQLGARGGPQAAAVGAEGEGHLGQPQAAQAAPQAPGGGFPELDLQAALVG